MRRWSAAVALALAAACSGQGSEPDATPTELPSTSPPSTPSPPAAAAAAPPGSSWPTYHGTADRAGDAGAGTQLPARLRVRWEAGLDEAVYGAPVLAGDLALVATEGNTVYALEARTGRQVWRRNLGTPVRRADLPCGNIDPLGITGTPAYDPATGSVLVVAETTGAHHTLWALDGRTGAQRWHRDLDVAPGRDRHAEQQRAALLVTAGRVLTAFGGLAGDCGNYVGYVTSVPVTGRGPTAVYAVPTAREAGIWAAAGPVAQGGRVLVASGNGAATGGRYDGSDSVIALDPVSLRRLALFAPRTWAADNAADADLGSLAPVPVGQQVVIAGKSGTVYLLPHDLGGVGGELATVEGCRAFGGAARRGSTVYLPCTDGVRALVVGNGRLGWSWQSGVPGSPVLAGDVLYALDPQAGTLHVLALHDGTQRQEVPVGVTSRFATPTVAAAERLLLVPTMEGVVAVG